MAKKLNRMESKNRFVIDSSKPRVDAGIPNRFKPARNAATLHATAAVDDLVGGADGKRYSVGRR